MADVIFLHKNLDTTSYSSIVLTASQAMATGFPLTNLQDGYKQTVAKSNTTAQNQTFNFDLGAAFACNSIGIINHNFTAVGATAIILQTNTNDDADFTDAEERAPDLTVADTAVSYFPFASATKRYWRIFFSKGSALSAAPYMGEIYLGTRFDHTYKYKIGAGTKTGYQVVNQRTWDGADSAIQKYATVRRAWQLSFQILGTTYKTNFDTWFQSVKGSYRPFLMSLDAATTWYLVRVLQNEIEYKEVSADFWETTLDFEEQLG